MARGLDITGQRYGKLTAARRVGLAKNGNSMVALWLCECDCGMSREAPIVELRRGRIVSCGCSSKNRLKDLSGVRFGYWTAIELSPKRTPERALRLRVREPKGRPISASDLWRVTVMRMHAP